VNELEPLTTEPRRDSDRGPLVLLAALGAWTIVTPYLGPLVGFELDVAGTVEVVDHVVPGTVVVLATFVALSGGRRGRPTSGDLASIGALGLAFLGGFWVASTHVPLIGEAVRGESPWGATVWHNSGGLAILGLTLWLLVGPLLRDVPRRPG